MDALHWLIWLTLLYAVVLVAALAAGLIAIARALIVTKTNLARIEAGLAGAERHTEPLAESLETVNSALLAISGGLSLLLDRLGTADESLGRFAERLVTRR